MSDLFTRLAEILEDYDPYLELRCLPMNHRTTPFERGNPYTIIDTRTNTIVRYVSLRDDPHLVLADIFDMDNVHNDLIKRLDRINAARKAFELKKWMESREEALDLSLFWLKTEKNVVKHNGKKYDDQMRLIT